MNQIHNLMKVELVLVLALAGASLSATAEETDPFLWPAGATIENNKAFVEPLETVTVFYTWPIRPYGDQKASILCDGITVAESVSIETVNDKDVTGYEGAAMIHFDKQELPKGKQYQLYLPYGLLAWTEKPTWIQVTTHEAFISFYVPDDFGPEEIYLSNALVDSREGMCISFDYQVEATEDACFNLYREEEKVAQLPIEIESWPWMGSHISPHFDDIFIFEKDVRYRLELPAGSVRCIKRNDIVNTEVSHPFVGLWTDPSSDFTYEFCSLYNDHSGIIGEVTFHFDRPISLTPDAKVQLWEGTECETLIKEVTPWINTDVNHWVLVADFGGIPLTSEKGYLLVIPQGVILSDNEIIDGKKPTNARSELRIYGWSSIDNIDADTPSVDPDAPVYNLQGIRVAHLIPGQPYIQNGHKFIHR